MPTTKAHKTRHHSNLRPKHRHTKKYLDTYWPYIPLMIISMLILAVVQPWHMGVFGGKVLPYATNMSASALLQSTNEQRLQSGQSKLKLNKELTHAAQAKAQDMASKNYWSHLTPGGDAPWVFISDSGYEYQKAGENLAYGFLTSQQVIAGWMNSPSHRANILDTSYKDVGFGFADSADFDHNGPSTIVVALYGAPLGVTSDAEQLAPTTASSNSSYNSQSPAGSLPNQQEVSKIQMLTNGKLPWANYLGVGLASAALMYLLIKHGVRLKRWIHEGEKFVLTHPAIDATVFTLGLLGVLIIQKIGVIL
jgi:uncharacterized protein YkwD